MFILLIKPLSYIKYLKLLLANVVWTFCADDTENHFELGWQLREFYYIPNRGFITNGKKKKNREIENMKCTTVLLLLSSTFKHRNSTLGFLSVMCSIKPIITASQPHVRREIQLKRYTHN